MSAHEHASDLLFELADVETLPTELARVLHVRIVDPTAVGRAMLVLLREFKALATKVSQMVDIANEAGYTFAMRNDLFGYGPWLGDYVSREYMRPHIHAFVEVFENASLTTENRSLRVPFEQAFAACFELKKRMCEVQDPRHTNKRVRETSISLSEMMDVLEAAGTPWPSEKKNRTSGDVAKFHRWFKAHFAAHIESGVIIAVCTKGYTNYQGISPC